MQNKESNKIISCRVCRNNLLTNHLLAYDNMPSSAQSLPDKNNLINDKGIKLEICQCSVCGLVQINNDPVDYYREVIRAGSFSDEMINFRKKQFGKIIDKYKLKNKKIIEIGCGKGDYLSILNKLEVKAYGIEQSKESVNFCLKNKLKVTNGYIENSNYKIVNEPFDCFMILSFIEHLPNINSVLRGIYNNLKNDALGIVEVPNFDMILQKNLFSEFTRDHLFYFTKKTLINTLKFNGFNTIDCSIVWHNYIISAVVKKINIIETNNFNYKKIETSNFDYYKNKLINEVDKYIKFFDYKKVAVWGASHQAFAIISQIKFSKNILFIIDSAEFKQNKFTPATHIPIVSPKKLKSENLDAIIIMAASYSDEVIKILIKNYNKKFSISVIRENCLEIIRE